MMGSVAPVTSERVVWRLRGFPQVQREVVAFHIQIEVISPFIGRYANAIMYHAVGEPREIGPTNLKKRR